MAKSKVNKRARQCKCNCSAQVKELDKCCAKMARAVELLLKAVFPRQQHTSRKGVRNG